MKASERLSLNQRTVHQWTSLETIDGCARAGIGHIALWRDRVSEIGIQKAARAVRESGLQISSLCRGGHFPALNKLDYQANIDDNLCAIEEAAELGTDLLVLVCGADPSIKIQDARAMILEGIQTIAPFAKQHGVKLGIEPLHPMFAADRSAICSLAEANTIAKTIDNVGVVIDVYHTWWDTNLLREIERARGQILGFHVNDWIVPLPDILNGRGMMGDGVIDLKGIYNAVTAAGYDGPIEVEIFNQALWNQPGENVVKCVIERFSQHVLKPSEQT